MFDHDLKLALELSDDARSILIPENPVSKVTPLLKKDGTPVTELERSVERTLREKLATARPSDGILGEEYGESNSNGNRRQWVIDPVDGTESFSRGGSVWATLIALEIAGEVVVSVVSAPDLGSRWYAMKGGGSWRQSLITPDSNALQLHVSEVSEIENTCFSTSGPWGWAEHGLLRGFLQFVSRVRVARGYGDFWSHMLVAEGTVDIAADPDGEWWDHAAVSLIVREAGGTFTGIDGNRIGESSGRISSNGHLHDTLISALQDDQFEIDVRLVNING